MIDPVLYFVSPMPPKQNGIADYTFTVAQELSRHARVRIISDDPFAHTPRGTDLCDPEQIFRFAGQNAQFSYQIGNNPDHSFVLRALRQFPGVVTLHDLSLLYLYEISGTSPEHLSDLMMKSNAFLGRLWSLHQRNKLGGTNCRHALFDMLGEILSTSTHIIVHSDFAKTMITARYGQSVAPKISVIPHYAPPATRYDRDLARRTLEIPSNEMLILTSGFATQAKRFDWIIGALRNLARSGRRFIWIHAGNERAAEFPLSQEIEQASELAGRAKVTGYLAQDDLDRYIAAADIVLNLRFPSVGESSGTLARSFAAGACCVVSDTAGYAELPSDRVVHIPVSDPIPELANALRFLIDNPCVVKELGDRVKRWAVEDLSIDHVGRQYLSVFSPQPVLVRTPSMLPDQLDDVVVDQSEGDVDLVGNIVKALRRCSKKGRIRVPLRRIMVVPDMVASLNLKGVFEKQGFRIEDVFLRSVAPHSGNPETVSEIHILFSSGL